VKHKKLLIVFIVVVAMAVAATVAYAWWSATITSDTNTVSTGSVAMEMGGLPVTASGLVPQPDPDLDAADDEYADVTYFWVKNTSTIPLMFYGWLSDGSDNKDLRSYVNARIWLLGDATPPTEWTGYPGWDSTFQTGGPYVSFDGTVADLWSGQPAGINYLSSRAWYGGTWHRTPIGPGEQGVYRVAIWLDSTAPNSTQGATGSDALSFKINFTGMQEEQWDEDDYDSQPFVP
jgi:hypothetical protein